VQLIGKIRKAAERFTTLYVFRTSNSRMQVINEIREHWSDSKVFFGKNKVIQVALGRTSADEHADSLHLVSERLVGQCMLFFSNHPREEVEKYFGSFRATDFARMGMLVTQDVLVREGPLEQFAHSQEPYLRQLGLPTRLNKSVVMLERDFRLCEKGTKLTSEQARLLKAFNMPLAQTSFDLDCVWQNGEFEQVGAMDLDDNEDEQEEDEEEEEEEEEVEEDKPKKRGSKSKAKVQQEFVFVRE
jgi:mRNA turnover protein 4